MKRSLFILLTLFIVTAAYTEIKYFRSNEIGITLEKIEWYRVDEFEYVVTLEEKDNTVIKRLYKDEEEIKRWEIHFDKRMRKIKESEYQNNLLYAVLLYNKDGSLHEELLYTQGKLYEKKLYHYSKRGLSKVQTSNEIDEILYEDFYSLASSGRLRSVIRIWANGNIRISRFAFGSGLLVEQREYIENKMYIARFDSKGRLISWEQWQDDKLEKSKLIVYNPETGNKEREEETDHTANESIVRLYDDKGNLLKEDAASGSSIQSEVTYEYDDKGRLLVKRVKGPLGIEEWRYFYNDADKLVKEEYWRRGFHEKTTFYTEETSYYEEIYRENEVFLRVYYENEKKVKEEFIIDGKIEKVRTFEDGP
jgi:YD repeat-containing protein